MPDAKRYEKMVPEGAKCMDKLKNSFWSITKCVFGAGHQLLDLPGGFWQGAASKGAAQVQSCVPCSLCRQVAAHAQCMPVVPHSSALMPSHL